MSNSQNLRIRRVAYPNQSYDSALSAATNKQLNIWNMSAKNGSGSTNDVAIGFKQNNIKFKIARAGVNTDVSSENIFELVSFAITTGDTSGATFTAQYWNGSSFVSLTLNNSSPLTSVGQANFLFAAPIDWVKDGSGYYTIRLVGTLPPNFVYSDYKVASILAYRKGVLPEANLQLRFDERQLLLQQGTEILGFFAYPSPSNTIEVAYQEN